MAPEAVELVPESIPEPVLDAGSATTLDEKPKRDVKRLRQEKIDFTPSKQDVRKFKRHQSAKYEEEKNGKRRRRLELQERLNDEAVKRLAASQLLLTETAGYLEAEDDEQTYRLKQKDIVRQLDIDSAAKTFDIELSFGPYKVDFTRNGRHLLCGGRNGALSVIDCLTMQPKTEINVRETVRDVCFLQNESMWAAAQKKYVYIYDHSGIELHCLREHMMTYRMEFLPFHYLLTTIGEFGELRYLDISTGLVPAAYRTKKGPCSVMCQNPSTGVIQLGHGNGSVSLWTPNVGKPIVEFLSHGGKLTAMQCVGEHHLATAGLDGSWKIWDMRKFDVLHKFNYFGSAPSTIVTSQTGLLGIGFGPHLQIWKDVCREAKPKTPYMTHEMNGNIVQSLAFRPFEDFCAVGSAKGIHSIVVPGSCLANYDSHSADPYETKKQRQEREVHSLLEKLPASTITFDPRRLGMLDEAPRTLILEEQESEKRRLVEMKENSKKKKKKTGAAAQAFADRKKYAELQKKLAQKRQLDEQLAARGKEQLERLEEEEDVENEEKEQQENKEKKSSKDALDRFRKREKAQYT